MESTLELWKSPVCTGDVPPLQPGEHMTVGQVRHPDLQRAFAAEFSKWFLSAKKACKRWKTAKKLADTAVPHLLSLVNSNLTKNVISTTTAALAERLGWDKVTCKQLKAMLESCARPEQALRLLLRNSRSHPATHAAEAAAKQKQKQGQANSSIKSDSDEDTDEGSEGEDDTHSMWERQHSWLALPRDVPVKGVRVGVVPESDPRGPLRGQKGIWAAEELAEGHLLGPYRHYCMYTKAFDAILKCKPSTWQGTNASWKLQLDSYACNDDTGEVGVVEISANEEGPAPPGKYSLIFSGFGYGNETAYANDPHLDPVTNLTLPNMPDNYLGPNIPDPAGTGEELPNTAQIVCVSICGWAYAFMITIQPVRKDYEVLYDYGYSYWLIAADGINACNREEKERKMFEEHQAKLQALEEQLRAATQASSGLTTSLNNTSIHPASTQDVSQTAAAQAAPKPPVSQWVPADSGNGSTGPSAGFSSVRQQLHGMQLAQDSSARKDGSGGRSMSTGVGASVAQQGPGQMQQGQEQRQDESQQQEAGEGKRREGGPTWSAGEAEGSTGAVAATASKCDSPVEEQDDACSALLRSVRGYAGLQLTEQQLEVLQRGQQLVSARQHVTQTMDAAGNLKQVQRIDDPDVETMIQLVQTALSDELLQYPNGIAFSKLKQGWWTQFKAVHRYFCDKWDFIVRHSQLFELSEQHFSRNTKIHLTPEWREALEAQRKAEGRPVITQQQYSSNKRKRGEITRTEVKVIRDDAAERQLRKQLQQREDELQEACGRIKQLQQAQEGLVRDVQQLIELAQDARLKVPSQLLKMLQRQLLAAVGGGGGSRGGVAARSKADRCRHSRSRSTSRSRNGAGRRDSRDRYEKSSRRSSRSRSRSRSKSRNGGGRRESRDRYGHSNKHSSRRSSRSRSRSSSRSRGGAAWRSHSSGDRAPGRTAPASRSQPPAIDPSLFNVARAPLAALHGGGGSDTESRSETPDGLLGHDDASDSEDGKVAEQGPSRGAAAAGGVNGRAAAKSRADHGSKQGMVQPAGYGGIARAVDREGRDGDRSGLDRGYDSTDSGYRQHDSTRWQQSQQQRGSQREGRRDAYDDRGQGSDGVQYDRKSGRDSREGDQSRRYDAAGSRYSSSSGKGGQYRRS